MKRRDKRSETNHQGRVPAGSVGMSETPERLQFADMMYGLDGERTIVVPAGVEFTCPVRPESPKTRRVRRHAEILLVKNLNMPFVTIEEKPGDK
jgi:hypothetical protein